MTIATISLGYRRDRNMDANADDARLFVSRVKDVAERLDAVSERATGAGVRMLDALNQRAANKSVSALENLCVDLEARLERLQSMRWTG